MPTNQGAWIAANLVGLFRRAARSGGGWSLAIPVLALISFTSPAALADTFNVTGTT